MVQTFHHVLDLVPADESGERSDECTQVGLNVFDLSPLTLNEHGTGRLSP